MKAWIWAVFAVIILLAIAFFISENRDNPFFGNYGNGDNNGIVPSGEYNNADNSSRNQTEANNTINNAGSGGAESGGASTGGIEAGNKEESLPSDIDTAACGLYYSGYGVCSGTCPSGECVSEGRSCYCKNS